MRREVETWIRQASKDLDDAEYNFRGRRFSLAAFLCQQAVEKALKAFFLNEMRTEIPRSHSLIFLAKQTSMPKAFHPFLRELTPAFIDTRYPDAGTGHDSDIYDETAAKRFLKKSKEVLGWIKGKLSTSS